MKRKLMSSVALALVIGTGSVLAQDPATPTTPRDDPYRSYDRGDDDGGPGFGWIGLLGLAGLIGLRRTSHANEPMAHRTPAGVAR